MDIILCILTECPFLAGDVINISWTVKRSVQIFSQAIVSIGVKYFGNWCKQTRNSSELKRSFLSPTVQVPSFPDPNLLFGLRCKLFSNKDRLLFINFFSER